jgi:hypothetical protein
MVPVVLGFEILLIFFGGFAAIPLLKIRFHISNQKLNPLLIVSSTEVTPYSGGVFVPVTPDQLFILGAQGIEFEFRAFPVGLCFWLAV